VTGTGDKIFSAGWDLKELANADDPDAAPTESIPTPSGFAGITEHWDLKKPLIAALNGHAVGGGLEVAIACDVILAADHVELFLPEMQSGFLPDTGAIQRLPRLIPFNVAMEMMLTGRRMSAAEAKSWGLVHDVVPSDALMARARQMAHEIAAGAPLALQPLKEVLAPMRYMTVSEAFQTTLHAVTTTTPGKGRFPTYKRMNASDDFLEGARAFAEKRDPDFSGQ
jgi:crotonobetainyl-CoA hydratase